MMQRISELDGLRGIAILLVLMRHYIHHPRLLLLGPQWGWMGVNLFFVLSGFLITSILLRLAKQPNAGLRTFYARRTLRIFPLYYLALLVYFVASASVGTPQPLKTVVLYATFLQAFIPPLVTHLQVVPHPAWVIMGFGVLWSLSVEEYFYVLWAPLVVWTRARRRVLFVILGLVLLATPWIRFYYPDPRGAQELFIAQMDSLAAGCLIAILWQDHATALRGFVERRANLLHLCVAVLVGIAIWIDFATGISKRNVVALRLFNATDYTVLWLAWSLWLLVTLGIAGTSGWMPRLLRHPILVWLGKISYCLYVVHYPIYLALRNYMAHSIALPFGLAISLAISWFSWRYFEGPIASWKQHAFRYRMESQPEAPIARC
jgi:peptidoglycan/LPS O-acetylase OafA/YrhL